MNNYSKEKLLKTAVSFLFAVTLSIPVIVLFYEAIRTPSSSILLLINRYTPPFITTVILAGIVSVLCCLISITALYALSLLTDKARQIFIKLIPLSLVFPPFVGAIIYIDIFKSQTALLIMGNSSYAEFFQAAGTLALFLYPYVFLPLYNKIRMIEPAHAKILALYKLSFWNKMRLYYIPHVKQAVFNSMLLVFIYVSADFAAVSILRIRTITTEIYDEMIFRSGKGEAAIISLALLLFVAFITLYGRLLLGKNVTSAVPPPLQHINQSKKNQFFLGIGILLIIISFSVILPFLKVLFWLFSYWADTSSFKTVWISAKYSLFQISLNTLLIALAVTVFTVATSYVYFLIKMRTLLKRFSFISQLSTVIYALPGIIVAFSVVIFKQYLPTGLFMHWVLFLYGYLLRFVGIAFMILEPAFRSLSPQIVKIGDVFISDKKEYIAKIILPSTKQSIIYSGNYIFFNVVRELNIPLLLLPLGAEVLSMRIWQTASVGLYTYSAPAIGILLLISTPSILLYIKDRI